MAGFGEVTSGSWQGRPDTSDYRSLWLSDIYIERITWTAAGSWRPDRQPSDFAVDLAPGSVTVRFWLGGGQVVEKVLDGDGGVVGYFAPVTMPWEQSGERLMARALGLGLWIAPSGQVMVIGETEFDRWAQGDQVAPVLVEHAEARIRELTTLTAQHKFPPALVRNFAIVTEDQP